jgi:cobalamin biosynthesis protein CobT
MPTISKWDGEQRFAHDLANAPQGIGATRTNLQRLLHSLDFVGWSKSEESGRLDRRALTKFASGSVNVFSRREHVQAETSAVSVLIDCSGSMNDGDNNASRIEIAQKVTVHLSKMLQQARVPFAVTGFRNGKVGYLDNGGVIESPHFLPFKPWRKTLQQSLPTIGSISGCASGGTPDYTALANAIDELAVRPEHRRILFIITDAEGYQRAHMEHLQKIADKVGVTIVAIGIQSYSVTRCFVNAVSVNDLSDLGKTAFNQLLKAVQRKVR